jgi:hypothetical protein
MIAEDTRLECVLRQLTRGVRHFGKVFADIHGANVFGGDSLSLQGLFSLHVLEKATQDVIIVDVFEDLTPRRLKKETTERVRLWNENTVG